MIELSGIEKSFAQPILRGIDLSIPEGISYGMIGPGASGKSVLLKIITGLMRPDAGSVRVDGRDILTMTDLELQEFRKGIGMQFQNMALFDFMTVGENVAFPLRRLFDLPEEEVGRRVSERLERVRLPGFQERMPGGLSGGQKRRVAVARATVAAPPIVLYDEPAAGLDPVTSQKIFDLLREEQQDAKATVLMVSSDLDRMLPTVDRVGMMLDGTLIFDGTPEEARNSSDERVYQFVNGLPDGPL